MTYDDVGVTLLTQPYREHDRLYTIYTKEHGKQTLLARGSGKIASKLAGHLDHPTCASLMIAVGRRFDVLAQARTIHAYPDIHRCYEKRMLAWAVIEPLHFLTKDEEQDIPLFTLLTNALERLDNGWSNVHASAFLTSYLYHLLRVLGLAPKLDACGRCNTPQHGSVFFEPNDSSIVCFRCASPSSKSVNGLQADFLQQQAFLPFDEYDTLQERDQFCSVIFAYLLYLMEGRPIHAIKLLHEKIRTE